MSDAHYLDQLRAAQAKHDNAEPMEYRRTAYPCDVCLGYGVIDPDPEDPACCACDCHATWHARTFDVPWRVPNRCRACEEWHRCLVCGGAGVV